MAIRTPDQRLRVFVSSTLEELAPEREAAREAVEQLRLAPVMFELGARPHPPRALYRAYLDQSQVFVGVYWQSYGWVAPDMDVSGIEDEYELSAGKPSLVYLKEPAPDRQPGLDRLLRRVADENRVSFKKFRTPEELRALLLDDLALLLTERFEAGEEPAETASLLRPRPLPVPPTGLVGREEDVAAVCRLMRRDDVRLLTLSGLGGVGKTRLALAAAAELRPSFADGVGFVDLASVRSAGLVPTAVAVALGIPQEGTQSPADLVSERLRAAEVLLVLDNFEHLLEAGAFVARLLSECPSLKLLVTSRTLLRLRGEHEFRVTPLATPARAEPAAADVGERAEPVTESAAVRLFVERAQDSRPGFTVDETNAESVGELCSRLEGIPLAIELAAARVRVLSPQALLDRIGDHLDVLSGPSDLPERQRTLRATVDWSHDLLEPREREVFAGLSVFVAGFTLDAAEAVFEGSVDVLDQVSALVEKSLVVPQEPGDAEPRFRMVELVRQYAEERLEESGDAAGSRRRMAEYFAAFGVEASEALLTSRHQAWLARIDPEVDNLRAAVAWAREQGDLHLCLTALVTPWVYWWARGYVAELRPLVEQLLRENPRLDRPDRGLLLQAAASSRALTGDYEASNAVLAELAALQEELGDEHGLAMTRAQIVAGRSTESAVESRKLLDEAIPVLVGLGDNWGAAFALGVLGQVLLCAGENADAERVQGESLEHALAVGSEHILGLLMNERGLTAIALGDLPLARARYAESARLHRRVRNRDGLSYCLDGLARLALAEGRPEPAARAIGAADAVRARIGARVSPPWQSLRQPLLTDVRDALGAEQFAAAQAAGAGTDPYALVEELLA